MPPLSHFIDELALATLADFALSDSREPDPIAGEYERVALYFPSPGDGEALKGSERATIHEEINLLLEIFTYEVREPPIEAN